MFSRTGLGTLARGALLSARVPCVSSRSGADVLILCRHCRPHRRREDRHQQGPGGVPEPPADGGGPGHRGVHHTLHRQPEAGGAPACGSKLCAPGGRLAQRAPSWPLPLHAQITVAACHGAVPFSGTSPREATAPASRLGVTEELGGAESRPHPASRAARTRVCCRWVTWPRSYAVMQSGARAQPSG